MGKNAITLGERLKYARERAGLTMAQVKERTEIGGSSLSDFENGKREPSISQLASLGRCYRRSVAFFVSEGALPKEVVLWRKRPPAQAEAIEAEFLALCERYHNLEVWTDKTATVELPFVHGEAETFGFPQAELLAKKVRQDLSLGAQPALALLRELEEDCGLKLFHLDFEPTGTAACALSPTFGAAILLNAKNARWRRNFDLAHELFHLLTWNVFNPPGGNAGEHPAREEKLADSFASNLLMPEESVRASVNARMRDHKLPLDAVFEIARQFDVSVEAMLWRIHWLYRTKADKARTERDIESAKASASLYEDREQTTPPARPARFHALAVSALRKGDISLGRFAEYVGISRRQAMEYVEQESGADEAIELASA